MNLPTMKNRYWKVARSGHQICVILTRSDSLASIQAVHRVVEKYFGGKIRPNPVHNPEVYRLDNGKTVTLTTINANREYVETHYGLTYYDATATKKEATT